MANATRLPAAGTATPELDEASAPGADGPVRRCGYATTLRVYRFGRRDPTTSIAGTDQAGELWRSTLTPSGPGTLRLRWAGERVDAEGWGEGGDWLVERVPALTGQLDRPELVHTGHRAVLRAQHRHPWLRLGASGTLYHELLPVIIGQRITAGEAVAQWHRVVRELGDPAPGPNRAMRLPPAPAALARRPAWWFHRLGIEAKRADTLREVGRHAAHVQRWGLADPSTCRAKLALLRGIGPWTIGSTLGPALGDPDAFAIGDYHLKNTVAWALAGRPRGTDDEMVELLAPYVGQRGRVVRLLELDGHHAPAFGPRQRILPMHRW